MSVQPVLQEGFVIVPLQISQMIEPTFSFWNRLYHGPTRAAVSRIRCTAGLTTRSTLHREPLALVLPSVSEPALLTE